jgi:hypothetical protein
MDNADMMDMRSEAATNRFWQQGLQDIANISQRNKRDKKLQENQDLMMNMMGYGRDFDINGYKGANTGGAAGNTAGNTSGVSSVPTVYPGPVSGMSEEEWNNQANVATNPSQTEAQKLRLQTELGTYPQKEDKNSTWSAMDGLSNGLTVGGAEAANNALGTDITSPGSYNLLSDGMNKAGGISTLIDNSTTNLDEQEAESFGQGSV